MVTDDRSLVKQKMECVGIQVHQCFSGSCLSIDTMALISRHKFMVIVE